MMDVSTTFLEKELFVWVIMRDELSQEKETHV